MENRSMDLSAFKDFLIKNLSDIQKLFTTTGPTYGVSYVGVLEDGEKKIQLTYSPIKGETDCIDIIVRAPNKQLAHVLLKFRPENGKIFLEKLFFTTVLGEYSLKFESSIKELFSGMLHRNVSLMEGVDKVQAEKVWVPFRLKIFDLLTKILRLKNQNYEISQEKISGTERNMFVVLDERIPRIPEFEDKDDEEYWKKRFVGTAQNIADTLALIEL